MKYHRWLCASLKDIVGIVLELWMRELNFNFRKSVVSNYFFGEFELIES